MVRVAGNGLGSEVMGSLRYAVEHLGSLKLVVVLDGAVVTAGDDDQPTARRAHTLGELS